MGFKDNFLKSQKNIRAGKQVNKTCPECKTNWIGFTHSKCPACGCSKSGFEITKTVEERNKLVSANIKLARSIASILCKNRDQLDDCTSIAYMALIEAADRYKPAKGAYTTFATWWIKKRVIQFINNETPISEGCKENNNIKKAVIIDIDKYYSDKNDNGDYTGFNVPEQLQFNDDTLKLQFEAEDLNAILKILPSRHYNFVKLYISEGTYERAGEVMGVSKQSVEITISEAIGMIKGAMKRGILV